MKAYPFRASALLRILLLLLVASIARAADPLIAFGLSFVPLEGTTLTYRSDPQCLDVNSDTSAAATNFGISTLLGQAEQGAFLHVTPLEQDIDMRVTAYGSVNGATNQAIATLHILEQDWLTYSMTADFSALGSTKLVVSFWFGNEVQLQYTNDTSIVTIAGDLQVDWFFISRFNPFWRMPNGECGLLVEFDTPILIPTGSPPLTERPECDKLFIRPLAPTRTVDYVSQIDLTCPTNQLTFTVYEALLGKFNHAHKAVGTAIIDSHAGSLTVTNFPQADITSGLSIDLAKAGAVYTNAAHPALLEAADSFELNFLPIPLNTEGASLTLDAGGIKRQDDGSPYATDFGLLNLFYSGGNLQFRLFYPWGSYTRWSFYNQGQFVGSVLDLGIRWPAPVTNPPALLACGVNAWGMTDAASFMLKFDQPITLDLSIYGQATNILSGDQIYIGAFDWDRPSSTKPALYSSFHNFNLTARSLPSITITNETQRAGTLLLPTLSICRSGAANEASMTVSWTDATLHYYLESASTLQGPWAAVTNGTILLHSDFSTLQFNPTPGNCFFRLNKHKYY